MMEKITVEDNEFFKVITTTEIVPNTEKMEEELKNYFNTNLIDDTKYTFDGININGSRNQNGTVDISVTFEREGEWPIDEDFSSDDNFDAFLSDLSTRYRATVDYPWYYLPK